MQQRPTDRAWRAGRAGLASALAVVVALAAHLAGGGEAPPAVAVLAVMALAWPATTLLIGARPRLWRQAAVIGVAQLAMHALFAVGAAPLSNRAAPTASGMAGMPGTGSAGALPLGGSGAVAQALAAAHPHATGHGAAPLSAALMTGPGMGSAGQAGMGLSHTLAWMVTVAAWRWGEAAVQQLLEHLPRPMRLQPVTLPRPTAVRTQWPCVPVQHRPVLLAPPPRRGPPLAA